MRATSPAISLSSVALATGSILTSRRAGSVRAPARASAFGAARISGFALERTSGFAAGRGGVIAAG
jgi:hypothetical protein